MRRISIAVLVTVVVGAVVGRAWGAERGGFQEWTVDGVKRTGLVFAPSKGEGPAPVVFMFHGHGGTAGHAARGSRIEELWPEAVVVYLQGLPTTGVIVDPEGKLPGWQVRAGQDGDRDLKFFDVVWKWVKANYKVDEKRVFCTGHSNGGVFVYLLWGERGDVFAAVGPSGAVTGLANARKLTAKPVIHCAGRQDTTVAFEKQERVIRRVLEIDGCTGAGEKVSPELTKYEPKGKGGAVVETYIYDGGHKPPGEEWGEVVKFFRGVGARSNE